VNAAMNALGIKKAVLIGDTPDDISAANFAKIGGIGALVVNNDTPLNRAALEKAGSLTVISNLEELVGLLQK